MGFGRTVAHSAFGTVLLLSAFSSSAAPDEPLIVTRLADPDPDYVARGVATSQASEANAESKVEQAMESFGRAIGDAEILQQQRIEALCRAGEPTNAKPEQRFAYEASCRYSRH
jgi:hypothetical protein